MVWFKRSLHSAQVSLTKLSLTIKTDDITSSGKNVDQHGWLRLAQGRMG